MRQPSVSFDEVVRAATGLIKSGKNPTVAAVRTAVGDRGSNTTINQYLNDWRASLQEDGLQQLPKSLPEALLEPMETFFNVAVVEAGRQFESAQSEFEAEKIRLVSTLAERDDTLADLRRRNAELESFSHELKDQVDRQEQERNALTGRTKELEQRLESAVRDLSESERLLEQKTKDHEAAFTRLETRYQEEVERFESTISEYKEQARKEEERFNLQNEYWAKEIDRSRRDGDARALKLEAEKEQLRAQLSQSADQTDSLRTLLQEAEKNLAGQRASTEGLEAQLLHMQNRSESQQSTIIACKESYARLRAEHDSWEEKLQLQDQQIVELSEALAEVQRQSSSEKDEPGGDQT
ncbi:DNA-binding protein [Hydrocarboniclastica marina]|uniref:KfrA N-terminal DNA-binding domain-containing protein n=1 Tax=Hydrocarboniclastica marina TaxID=2259620 RepID=A0A4P7XNN1_9ALTE|nr:DNA-binding protein [Hydrocarboniclastica marina]QCF28047.1 hypothetical protein soil367_18410 [Hydrocarboniclastica marina]